MSPSAKFSVFALFCCAVASSRLLAADDDSPAAKPNGTVHVVKESSQLTGDRKLLQGVWEPSVMRYNGELLEVADKDKVVFTPTECTWQGVKYGYILVETTNPKIMVLALPTTLPGKFACIGIYERAGNALQLCIAEGSEAKPPSTFNSMPGDKLRMIVLGQDAAPQKAKAQYREEINAFVDKAIPLLDAEKYDEFIDFAVPPDVLQRETPEKHQETLGKLKAARPQILATLRAIKTIEPKLNLEETGAAFDVEKVAEGFAEKTVHLKRIGDRWYFGN